MANIPLNFFKRMAFSLTTTTSAVYITPFDRAGIVLAMYATNLTNNDVTVSVSFSGTGALFVPKLPQVFYAKDILIAGNDTTNLTPSKIVLNQYDALIVSCSQNNSIILNTSILETLNTVA